MNRFTLIGRLAKDIEMIYIKSGTALSSSSLAFSDKYKREKTIFVDIVVFGKLAETFNKYLKKGSRVAIAGRLDLQTWEDNSGSKRSKHILIVEEFEMLDCKGRGKKNTYGDNSSGEREENKMEIDIDDDEIPF